MSAHRIAKILVGLIFGLLLLGGVVHNTGSSLACPDWPTCYGSLMPQMTGGVAIEHGHRLLAAAVGLLTILLAASLYKERSPLKRLGLLAVFLVIFQGVLGGITVLYRLPDLVSTAHLGTSFLYFALILSIAWRTGEAAVVEVKNAGTLRFVTVLVFLQSLLGAFVRHTNSGLVCPDIPFCLGEAWPFGMHPMFQLHMAHRWLAVFVGLCVFSLPLVVKSDSPKVKRLIALACGAVLLQIGLGVASVLTHLGIVAVTGHLGGAALLWGAMVSLTILTSLNPLPNRERVAAEGGRVREGAPSDFIALIKPRVTALVLVTTLGGLWLAPETPSQTLIIFTLLGTVLLVGAANALNMYLERDSDALMARTKNRPLPARRMHPRVALWFGVFLAVVSVVILTLWVNVLTGVLGVIAFLSYVLFYTPLKQKSYAALLVGAVPGAMPPLMGWTAATGTLKLPEDFPGLVLFSILFLWQIPHFLAIALFRQKEYEKAGIKILPSEKGVSATKHMIVRYLAGLVAVSFYPVSFGLAGQAYLFTALILGAIFFTWGCYGLRTRAGVRWARGFFLASIIYLPVLLFALVVAS